VLQQRVRWQVGCTDFRKVAIRYGSRTPAGTAFPSPERLAQVPVFELEALGLDQKRARALHGLARAQVFRPFLIPDADMSEVRNRLLAVPGIGPWTTEMTLGYAYGDSDAVPVGDLHLPGMVAFALAGEESASDERMLELLQPYQGQRFRVIRLLLWAWQRLPHLMA
jgi:3-methyladenine DNA glycosylase/8-oxoguanine DNA glycosylase